MLASERGDASEDRSPAHSTTRTDRPWLVLAAMALPLLALSMDVNGAGTLLTPIAQDFGVGADAIGWVVNASALTFAALLIAVGKVAPRLGDRRLVLAGVVVFGIASLLAGVAPTYSVLIAARVGQGIGGVLMFTTSLAVIDRVFDDARRPAAIGAWGVVNGVGGAIGPLVGGALTSWWSWRGFFLVAVPFCIVAFPVIAWLTPADPPAPRDPEPVPWARLSLLAIAVVAGIVGVQSWGGEGGDAGSILALGIATVAVFALVLAHRVSPAVSAHPVLAPAVTRAPLFRPAAVVGFCANWGFGVIIVFVGIELQAVRGLAPLQAGLVFSVFSISCAVAGLVIGPLTRRLGIARALIVAMASTTVALAAGAALDGTTPLAVLGVGLAVAGLGQGLAFDVGTLASLEGVPGHLAAEASGVLSTVRSVGLTVGVAVSSAIAVSSAAAPDRGVPQALALAAIVAIVGTVATAAAVPRRPRTAT